MSVFGGESFIFAVVIFVTVSTTTPAVRVSATIATIFRPVRHVCTVVDVKIITTMGASDPIGAIVAVSFGVVATIYTAVSDLAVIVHVLIVSVDVRGYNAAAVLVNPEITSF